MTQLLNRQKQPLNGEARSIKPEQKPESLKEPRNGLLVAGSLAIDVMCDYQPTNLGASQPASGTSNPAKMVEIVGGVGHNIALAANYSGSNMLFCSIVGADDAGRNAVEKVRQKNMGTSVITMLKNARTARYIAFNDIKKDLVLAMADMDIMQSQSAVFEDRWWPIVRQFRPRWLAVDGNWDRKTLAKWIDAARRVGARVAFEPVSVEKSVQIFPEARGAFESRDVDIAQLADLATPNTMELLAMSQRHCSSEAWNEIVRMALNQDFMRQMLEKSKLSKTTTSVDVLAAALSLLPSISCILTKAGAAGVLLTEILRKGDKRLLDASENKHILLQNLSSLGCSPAEENTSVNILTQESWFQGVEGVYVRLFEPPAPVDAAKIVSVNGAGDTFLGVLLAGLVAENPRPMSALIQIAQEGAALSLQSLEPVSPSVRTLASKLTSP